MSWALAAASLGAGSCSASFSASREQRRSAFGVAQVEPALGDLADEVGALSCIRFGAGLQQRRAQQLAFALAFRIGQPVARRQIKPAAVMGRFERFAQRERLLGVFGDQRSRCLIAQRFAHAKRRERRQLLILFDPFWGERRQRAEQLNFFCTQTRLLKSWQQGLDQLQGELAPFGSA